MRRAAEAVPISRLPGHGLSWPGSTAPAAKGCTHLKPAVVGDPPPAGFCRGRTAPIAAGGGFAPQPEWRGCDHGAGCTARTMPRARPGFRPMWLEVMLARTPVPRSFLRPRLRAGTAGSDPGAAGHPAAPGNPECNALHQVATQAKTDLQVIRYRDDGVAFSLECLVMTIVTLSAQGQLLLPARLRGRFGLTASGPVGNGRKFPPSW